MFKVTTIGYSENYKNAEEYYADDFFGKKAGQAMLAQSNQANQGVLALLG